MLRYRIAAARRAAKLSKAQLARRLGVRTRVVADWERGEKRPSPFQIDQLARVLHPGFGKARIWFRAGGLSPGRQGVRDDHPAAAGEPSPATRSEALRAYRETRTCW